MLLKIKIWRDEINTLLPGLHEFSSWWARTHVHYLSKKYIYFSACFISWKTRKNSKQKEILKTVYWITSFLPSCNRDESECCVERFFLYSARDAGPMQRSSLLRFGAVNPTFSRAMMSSSARSSRQGSYGSPTPPPGFVLKTQSRCIFETIPFLLIS